VLCLRVDGDHSISTVVLLAMRAGSALLMRTPAVGTKHDGRVPGGQQTAPAAKDEHLWPPHVGLGKTRYRQVACLDQHINRDWHRKMLTVRHVPRRPERDAKLMLRCPSARLAS